MSATAVRLGDQATVTVTIGGQSTGVQPLQVHRECSLNFFAAFEDGCGTDFRQMSLDDFPLEVLSRILARLPDHRTVLRCCAVSKQWNALIRSEAFGQDHLLPCRRARHMWQGDGMHVMSNFKNLSDEDVGWLHVLRKGMVANGAEAWTCGHITTPADLVDGAHPGPCAAKGQWFDLLRELAFMEYLVRLVGGETRDNVYPPWNYSVRPVLFGTNLAALGDGVEVNEETFRTITGHVYSTSRPVSITPFELPAFAPQCTPFAHYCYDIAKRSDAPPECYPWNRIRETGWQGPVRGPSDYEKELFHDDPRLHAEIVHRRLLHDPAGMGQPFLMLLGLGRYRQEQPLLAIMPSLHMAFRRLEKWGVGHKIYKVVALDDSAQPTRFPDVDLDMFWVVQSPRTGRLIGLGTFVGHDDLPRPR